MAGIPLFDQCPNGQLLILSKDRRQREIAESGFVPLRARLPMRYSSTTSTRLRCLAVLLLLATGDSCRSMDDSLSARRRIADATVRILSGNDVCSGVFVSPAGHILTVAHGVHPEAGPVRIVRAMSKPEEATVLIRDSSADVALLKWEKADDAVDPAYLLPELQELPQPEQMVIACGLPAREPSLNIGILRTGTVVVASEQSIRSTCMLTAGDSGGPLVNSQGRLIGLHHQIGVGSQANLHLPIRKVLEVIRSEVPESESSKQPQPASQIRLIPEQLKLSDDVLQKVMNRTVRISQDDSGRTAIHGFMVSRTMLVTKYSELNPSKPIRVFGAGKSVSHNVVSATILRSDQASDIAVLKLDAELTIDDSAFALPSRSLAAGEFAFAFSSTTQRRMTNGLEKSTPLATARNGGEPLRTIVGIQGRSSFDEPTSKPRLGIVLDEKRSSDSMIIQNVLPSSAASEAGLKVGDRLLSADGQMLESPELLGIVLRSLQPGDWLTLQIQSAQTVTTDQPITSVLRLRGDPSNQFEKTEFLDGRAGAVSERRTGFAQVLQIDCAVEPQDCGTAVVSADGALVGIVIARRAREATLVLSMQRVMEFADRSK